MLSTLAAELKSAGAVLTLSHSGSFLSTFPHFNGIYPLNNSNWADGIIVATGDPDIVTTLTSAYNPSSGGILPVESTLDAMGNTIWAAGDKGIIIGPSVDPADSSKTIGYYVFQVDATAPVTATSITRRSNPVYYSGLLATTNYTDNQTEMGNAVLYPEKSPVIKLSNFSIYLIRQAFSTDLNRNIRQLVRVTDANNQGDVLATSTTAQVSVVSENIWDMQISYTAYPNFPDVTSKAVYFAGGSSSTSMTNLLIDIRSKLFKELTVNFVVLTDEYGGRGERTLTVPVFGDRPSDYTLPAGKFNYKMLSILIEPRNFNIVI
jgi:hypothetical protein